MCHGAKRIEDRTGRTPILAILYQVEKHPSLAESDALYACLELLGNSVYSGDALLRRDPLGRTPLDLARASPHDRIRTLFAELDSKQRERDMLVALALRPPGPFDIVAFNRVWSKDRDSCEQLLFAMLDEWAFAPSEDGAQDRRAYSEEFVCPLVLFEERDAFQRLQRLANSKSRLLTER